MPAELAPQDWLWIGFPHRADLWEELTEPAQEQIAAYANAVAETGQEVRLVVHDAANEARARQLVSGAVTLERHPYGDIWLRDTGPIVLFDETGRRFARRFRFNGWGGKYDDMEGDQEVGRIARPRARGSTVEFADWVLEGGAIDSDGTGLVVTTEQCLLNPNRNPQLSRGEIEARLASDLGFDPRAVARQRARAATTPTGTSTTSRDSSRPTRWRCRLPTGPDDPNAAVYADARARASAIRGSRWPMCPRPASSKLATWSSRRAT